MLDGKTILITGVSEYWGSRVAEYLLAEQERTGEFIEQPASDSRPVNPHILGIDGVPRTDSIKSLDFIQTDIRNPLLVELLKAENVDTIIHLAFEENYFARETAFDLNVIGTMKVMGAAAEAGVKKVVLMSSTQVYGALPTNPAFLTEQQPLNGRQADGTTRNLVEIEAFCNGFRRQVPEMAIAILRFPGIIGPTVNSPMTRYLRLAPPPILLGFDPQMQIIHEDDVVSAIVHAVKNDVSGVFNIAADGVLPLAKILGLVGKIPLPVFHLCANWGSGLLRASGVDISKYYPISLDYLRFPWVADTSLMRDELDFSPLYTAEEALREFSSQLRVSKYKPQTRDLAVDEALLRDTLERRKRMREKISSSPEIVKETQNG